MSSLTNKALNTGTVTSNRELMAETSVLTWDEAEFTWDEATGTWNSPISIANKSLGTGSMTNRSYQDP